MTPRPAPRYYLRCCRADGTQAAVARSDDLDKLLSKAHNFPYWEISEYTGDVNGVAVYRLKMVSE